MPLRVHALLGIPEQEEPDDRFIALVADGKQADTPLTGTIRDGGDEHLLRDLIVARWIESGPAPERTGKEVLLREDGRPDWPVIEKLFNQRDLTRVQISE